jgi:elongation factor Tu
MLTGAIQMEGAILVVSVNDGPQVQTREHVILAKEVGIKHIIVFINKLDSVVERDMKDLVELEVRELLESYGYPVDLPVVKGSARLALREDSEDYSVIGMLSIKKLMDTVDSYIPQPLRLINAPFLLAIESIYVITGRGTVVTGKIEQGTLKENDDLELLGHEVKKTIAIGIEMFHKTLSIAEVGDNVGILIKNIKKEDVKRGYVLAMPGFMKIYKSFEAKVYILTKKEGGRHKPFVTNYKPQFFFRTSNVTGTLFLPEGVSVVMPGDNLNLRVELVEKVALNLGLKFVMREGTLTIGAGVITNLA